MNPLKINSLESLDAAVANVCRLKIEHTQAIAQMDAHIANIQKQYAPTLATLSTEIADAEVIILDYCTANRALLFSNKKSRETTSAWFGFEFTPPRVETASRKIKWSDVITRLRRLDWGKAYLRIADPKPDKEALLADRDKLTSSQLTAAGITFTQDEQFFIRPTATTAEATTIAQAA